MGEKMLIEHEILRFNQTKMDFEVLKDVIAVEAIINLYINNNLCVTFHCLPLQIKELIIGYLLTNGIIDDIRDILEIRFSEKNAYVKLSEEKFFNFFKKPTLISIFYSSESIPSHILEVIQKIRFNKIIFSIETILKAVDILNSKSSIFKVSGGTHAATLIDEECRVVAFAEDIGRHNAIDKAIGEAAMKNLDFSKLLLASTGRLSSEIVIKAVQMKIPILVSLSAPTSMGVKIAETFGLTLIGFAREGRVNIYSSPDRIEEWNRRHTGSII
ncbi:MAG: formate dehydrogenase accessory sulfurtransferase FdhD [Candidatus Bathyarchaeia archaeon]